MNILWAWRGRREYDAVGLIWNYFASQLEKPDDQQSQNELIMTFLRSLFEQKQALHSHTSKETPQDGGGNQSMQKQQVSEWVYVFLISDLACMCL